VTQSSWPSPAASRVVSDLQYERLVATQYVDGLIGSISDTPLVYADGSGRQVFLRASRYAQVRGHGWTSGGSDVTLPVTANSSGSTRTDLVVLGLNRSTWNVTGYIKDGTPGAGAPALQTDIGDTGIYEIPLAEITVANGATVIAADKITPRAWYARSDGASAAGSTATTRPPNPLSGMMLWQNGAKYCWNGSYWEPVSGETPAQTLQNTAYTGTSGPSGIDGSSAWRPFTSSLWPPLTFTVPPSGNFHLAVSGFIENTLTASSVIWLSYGAAGGGIDSGIDDNTLGPRGISARGGRFSGSNRKLFTGLTPGASITVTPYYFAGGASPSGATTMRYGRLEVEPE
jgi:hypothetical protein